MKYSYKFSSLIGAVYSDGNLIFLPDGYTVISPVGNRLTKYDLKHNTTQTLSLGSYRDINNIAISPDGALLLAVNIIGQAFLVNVATNAVIHEHKFQDGVQCVQFSPNGRYFAVVKNNMAFIFQTPGQLNGQYNSFMLHKHYTTGFNQITCLSWSSDSRFIAFGCRDNATRVMCLGHFKNVRDYTLHGHTDAIVGCFFEQTGLNLNTVSANGQLCLWQCSLQPSEIGNDNISETVIRRKKITADDNTDNEEDNDMSWPHTKSISEINTKEMQSNNEKQPHPFSYTKLSRHYLSAAVTNSNENVGSSNTILTAVDYNTRQKLLIVAFNTGSFYLYEMPDVNMIHSLQISDNPINTALFNNHGDWIALTAREMGLLLVWEWRSEQHIMKQQGNAGTMKCISYSPDGQYIATGDDNAKVKLWNVQSGFCVVTFTEHANAVTSVKFGKNKLLLSCSLDGSVRVFDLTRYRNFRTFTSTRDVQFTCVDIDQSNELVAASGYNIFEIYLWSMKQGKLLEVVSGHEGPISTIAFSPVMSSSTLVSGSWDKTIKIWNYMERNSDHETIDIMSDVISIAFAPSGKEIAVAALNGNITMFDLKTSTQCGVIEAQNDLRCLSDFKLGGRDPKGRYICSIDYSLDGECIIAAGKSSILCIYHVEKTVLLRKIVVAETSLRYTDIANIAKVTGRIEESHNELAALTAKKSDIGQRKFRSEISIFAVKYSASSQSFAFACTEGVCVYSLDNCMLFDPFYLSHEVTPKIVRQALEDQEYLKALIMASKLNDSILCGLVMESVSYNDVSLICSSLPKEFIPRLMEEIIVNLKKSSHIQFHLHWAICLLNACCNQDIFPQHMLVHLHETILYKFQAINKVCDFNKYSIRAFTKITERSRNKNKDSRTSDDESD